MPVPPPVLDSTVGGPNANTYALIADANTYLSGRGFGNFISPWDNATSDNIRASALIWATFRIDASFEWRGTAVSATQALCWPRNGLTNRNKFTIPSNVIPIELVRATCEFALQLLSEDRTLDNDAIKLGVTSIKAGSVSLDFQPIGSSQGGTAGDIQLRDADVIRQGPEFDFLWRAIPDAVRNFLPHHWYHRRMVSRPVILRTFR